jgi:hypothetical protein
VSAERVGFWLAVVAAGVTLWGCDSLEAPPRPAPYEFRLAGTDSVFHWPADRLPVKWYAEPAGALPDYVERGITVWERQFLYGEFRGRMTADSAEADVIVELQGTPPPEVPLTDDPPRDVCEGVTIVPPRVTTDEGVAVLAGRLRIVLWWFPTLDPVDVANCLARTTLHEMAHAMGIFGHSDDPADLMFRLPEVALPSYRDRATAQYLYHLPAYIRPWSPAVGVSGEGGWTIP